jgi:hypothetical protein
LSRIRCPIGGVHVLGDFLRDFLPQIEALAHDRVQVVIGVHVVENLRLPIVEGRFAHVLERQVGNRARASEGERQGVREGDGFGCGSGEGAGQSAEKTGAIIARTAQGLPELDAVLRLEVAA